MLNDLKRAIRAAMLSTIVVAAAIVSISQPTIGASKGKGASPSHSASPDANGSSSPSPSAAASASASPSAAPQVSAAASFESKILAYQAAASIGAKISAKVSNAASSGRLLVLTPTDVVAFGSLNVALSQGNLLNARLVNATSLIEKRCVPNPKGGFDVGPLELGSTTASAVSAWINIISSLSQINETTTSAQVTIPDSILVQMIALDTSHTTVVVPSVYLPSFSSLTGQSSLASMLSKLDINREALDSESIKPEAAKLCGPKTTLGKSISGQVSALDNLVTAFESSFAPSQQAGDSSTAPGQVLYADHIVSSVNPDGKAQYQILVVHSVDAGGTNLTKQTTLLGTRQYFSGGAIATYSLFSSSGTLQCMGIAYGYRGFIAAGDVSSAIGAGTGATSASNPGERLPDTANFNSQDCDSSTSTNAKVGTGH